MKARDYGGPVGVLAAGALGLSLLCSVSAMAMSDLSHRVAATLQPINIVDLAFSNIETVAALTEQAVTAFVPSPTLVPTNTLSPLSLTPLPSDTATPRRFVTVTPTPTHRERFTGTPFPPTSTHIPPPTKTNTPVPPPTKTNTPRPTVTDTPVPPITDTPSYP